MLIILSPSKTQDFKRDFFRKGLEKKFSVSEFNVETKLIFTVMKKFSKKGLEKLMNISPKLSELNFIRFKKWNENFLNREQKKEYNFSPAIFAFSGDVYNGFDLENWTKNDFIFANKKIKIISGIYGLLSPLDLIKGYRLEMGTKLRFQVKNQKYYNLYQFWENKITEKINLILEKEKILINLASVEYSKVINRETIKGEILDVYFKVHKKGKLKTIAIFAKRARGEMANWIIENKIKKKDDIKKFSVNNWKFYPKNSSKNIFVFVKK